jgi:hypothetical protein
VQQEKDSAFRKPSTPRQPLKQIPAATNTTATADPPFQNSKFLHQNRSFEKIELF